MRILFGFLLAAAVMAGEAEASSFITLEPLETKLGPSMIALGGPSPSVQFVAAPSMPGTRAATLSYPYPDGRDTGPAPVEPASIVRLSPSIIAMGEPEIAYEQVAAIEPEKPARNPHLPPMVIRGGVIGDAFIRSMPAADGSVLPETEQAASEAPSGSGGPKPTGDAPAREPIAPPPAPTPPAAPLRQPE